MSRATELYEKTIRQLPAPERLRVAALILRDLTRATEHAGDPGEPGMVQSQPGGEETSAQSRRSMLELLESLPPDPRLFKTPAEADRYLQAERDSWDR